MDNTVDNLSFLELSIPVRDVRRSLEWYRQLGLTELPTNDVRQHHYAVVSDGHFCIGLHDESLQAPSLSFVRKNLASAILDRIEAGEEFLSANLGIDDFHETIQSDPDGTHAIMLEARTFSPGHTDEEATKMGSLKNISIPCSNLRSSLAFWGNYGFMAVTSADPDCAELYAPGLTVQLESGTRHLVLRFEPADFDACISSFSDNLEALPFDDGTESGLALTAPEGTRLRLLRH